MTTKTIEALLRIRGDFKSALAGLGQVQSHIDGVGKSIDRVRGLAVGLLTAGVGAVGMRGLSELADAYSSLEARMRVATRGQQEFDAARAQSNALAKQYLAPLNETSTLYTRMLRAVGALGGGTREATVATEALLASLKINGATAAESASAILQFSQALGAGALRGEEFNAIAEAASPLLDALAAGLGKPRDELKSLAEQGKLTTSAILEALTKQLPELRRQAGQIPATIAGATHQVGDAFGRFIGQAASGSRAVQTIVTLLKLLADNIETVVTAIGTMTVVVASVKLAAFAQGLATAAAAASAGASGIAAFGLALRGIAGVLTGPVGLIVLVGSLAAAWLGLDRARQKAQDRSLDRVRAERAAVASEIADLQERAAKPGALPNSIDARRLYGLQRDLPKLDAELKALERRAFEAARQADQAGYGDQNALNLRDPRTVADFEKDNASRAAVLKDFADKRAAYVIAKDKDIALARLQGDKAAEQRLTQEKRAALEAQAREESAALKKFDQDTQVSRLAQAKELYDQRADLVRDALAREIKFNEEAFAQGLVDAETYLKERARLNAQQSQTEIADLEAQLGKMRAVYAANLKLPTQGLDANQRAERQEALLDQTEKIAKLEGDIEKKKRDQVDAQRALTLEAGLLGAELRRQSQAISIQLAEAQGKPLTDEQINQRVTEQFRGQLERIRALNGDDGPLLKLVDVEVTKQKLAQVEREFNQTFGALQQREQAINQDLAAGRVGSADAERQIVNLRRDEVRLLDEILARAQALATSPEERQRIEGYRRQLQGLRDFQVELEQVGRGAAISGLRTMLNDITTGAKSGKDALLDMVRGFAGALLDVLNKRLSEQLVDQAIKAAQGFSASIGSSGGGGGWGAVASWFASLFHSGGVVGSGSGAGRAIPAAAFAFAPRYHSGGIAGLRTNEVPAVLMRGEEVLTADDPRHARNLKGGRAMPTIGPIQVTVNTDGSGSTSGDKATGQRLGSLLQTTIQRVLLDEMRPGGILQDARRS